MRTQSASRASKVKFGANYVISIDFWMDYIRMNKT
jgi:hypothetical protein